MRVEIETRFHSEPRVRRAWHDSHASTGLFIRGLAWMAEHDWDPTPGSRRCIPGHMVDIWLGEGGRRINRRPVNALIRAELWVPFVNRKGEVSDGWNAVGQDELWRLRPDRESVSPAVRREVLERDGRVCQLCFGEIPEGDALHLDHRIPVSRGGRSTVENLQVTHARCNLRKGALILGGVV